MSESSSKNSVANWRVLVCDENRTHRRMVKRLIMDTGVGEVADSPVRFGAMEPISQFQPHLVVGRVTQTDRSMLELLKWLRNPELTPLPGVSVLVSVGNPSPPLLTLLIKAGADLLVAEPITLGALGTRIFSLITNPLPRITAKGYIGPDRRRTPQMAFHGTNRRQRATDTETAGAVGSTPASESVLKIGG